MSPEPQSDIRLDIHVNGVFIRTVVLTAAELVARAEVAIDVESGKARRWAVVELPLRGEPRLAIDVRRSIPHDGRPIEIHTYSYSYEGELLSREHRSCGEVTTFVYEGRPNRGVGDSESPPDEPHFTG